MDGDDSDKNKTSVEGKDPQENHPSYLNFIQQQPQKNDQELEEQKVVVKPQIQTSDVKIQQAKQNVQLEQTVEPQIQVQTVQSTQVPQTQVQNSQQQMVQMQIPQQQIQIPQQQFQQQQIMQIPQQQIMQMPQQQMVQMPQQQMQMPQQQLMQIPQQQIMQMPQQQMPQQQIQMPQQQVQVQQNQVESKKESDSMLDNKAVETTSSPLLMCLKHTGCSITLKVVVGLISLFGFLAILGIYGMCIYALVLMVQCPYSAVMQVESFRDFLLNDYIRQGNWEAHCDLNDYSNTAVGNGVGSVEDEFNAFWLACVLLLGGVIGFVLALIGAAALFGISYVLQMPKLPCYHVGHENSAIDHCLSMTNFVINVGNAGCSVVGAIFCCLCCPVWCCGTCTAFCCTFQTVLQSYYLSMGNKNYTCPNCSKTYIFQKTKGTKGKPKKNTFYRTEGKCFKCCNVGCAFSRNSLCEVCMYTIKDMDCKGEEGSSHVWQERIIEDGKIIADWRDFVD